MVDPVRTLVGALERELAAVPGVALLPGVGSDASDRFLATFGSLPPPGLKAFLVAHDGGRLPGGSKLFTLAEGAARLPAITAAGHAGLWPFLEHGGRQYALDAEGTTPDGEWPVVEVASGGLDRVGTSLLRFLHVLAAELTAGAAAGDAPAASTPRSLALAEERCRRDPGLADHWLELAQLQEEAGDDAAVDVTLASAVRSATPPTPALLFAVGMRAALHKDWAAAGRAFEDAMALEPLTARDDDARLDAAAVVYVLASERGDAAAVATSRRLLADGATATAAFWRVEALHAMGAEPEDADVPEVRLRVDLGSRIVAGLVPDDPDIARVKEPRAPATVSGLRALRRAREALELGRPEESVRLGRSAVEQLPELGAAWALLAEALNATHDKGALEAGRKATTLNPGLVEGWRELGDAELEAGDFRAAERAFRKVVEIDESYGLGYAKLAQVLLEQERTLEALEAIGAAAERGGDPFFVAAIRGDVYAEMERHTEAAEAYDDALKIDPEDHWALHQAAVEHGHAGHLTRASELFEEALKHDRDGCHQTLIDFGDLLRKSGRIGDAVRMYRKAVAAVPGDPEWKQTLKEAERELLAAPN
ncbi:MAG TPA: tetratricopeptide repeat protein [Polyangia bacterium]|jgi:tetratricopeptide (TPR) repeat protein